ncbi:MULTISPECIES: RHS repeat domain-containing protein [unclassified Pseudomonas]|uniref:RHS repeat domain-containing protein n=1 Tax=unclassified Pseudomonas TaxID=196821 RepID=UPI001F3328FE|nr:MULTISPECIES: RHS repeat-associated core domain-containing protein [unclassified Pseudomonas]
MNNPYNVMGTDASDSGTDPIFNATTQERNAVDPRTGLFELCLQMCTVIGNNGNGPTVKTDLNYTPVMNNEAGLGDGWSLRMSRWRAAHEKLTLHSGETIELKKNKNIKSTAVAATWSDGKLTVVRKDGRTEVLVLQSDSGDYMPESLTMDGENFVYFTWATTPHVINGKTYYQVKLTGIKDGRGRRLLEVVYVPAVMGSNYKPEMVYFIFWPDSLEKISYTLSIDDFVLRSVSLEDGSKTIYNYLPHPVCGRLLNETVNFDGLTESVEYKDNGLKFPNNPKLSALPCASTHTLTPTGKGTPVVTTYEYKRDGDNSKNYVTVKREGSPAIRSTHYRYDAQHNVQSETVKQGGVEVAKIYEYVQRPDFGGFNSVGVATTTTTYKKESKESSTVIQNVMNDDGALVRNIQDGVAREVGYADETVPFEKTLWLALSRKLDRYIPKPLTLTPNYFSTKTFPSSRVNVDMVYDGDLLPQGIRAFGKFDLSNVIHCNIYNDEFIENLSARKLTGTLRATFAADDAEEKVAFLSQQISYFETEDFRNGRQKSISQATVRPDHFIGEPARSFDYTLGGVDETELTTTTTDTDERGNQRTSSETHSTLSGRLIRQVDADGNRTDYGYDAYGKLATLTTCAQSPTYRQTTTYTYPALAQVQVTGPEGLTHLSLYDGQGRVVSEYRVEQGKNILIKAVSYDALGRELRTTHYKHTDNKLSEWEELEYDEWGQVRCRTYSDGRKVFDVYDPVALTRTQWAGKDTDKHAIVTHYNANKTIRKVEWKNQQGHVYQTQTATYNRVRQVKTLYTEGERGITTVEYSYDAFGRLLRETHSEKGKGATDVATVYAYRYTRSKHWLQPEAEQVDIEVDNKTYTLGKRSFDSWGRVTSITRGTSTETFTYTGASEVPAKTVTAQGSILEHEYIKELGNRLAKTRTANAGEEKTFTYAYGTQGISTASEGEHLLSYSHDLSLRVTEQSVKAEPGVTKRIKSDYSPQGRLLSVTSPLDLKAEFEYDSPKGLPCTTTGGDVLTKHLTDDQGRLTKESIHKKGSYDVLCTVNYAYDGSRGEVSRMFYGPKGVDFKVASAYENDGKLKSVELRQGNADNASKLPESKKYDTVLGRREYIYTPGGRLGTCLTTGVWCPKNPKGKDISKQVFTYDALGNVTTCVTTFSGGENTATYTYDGLKGFCLTKVDNSHADYTSTASLSYDLAGRVTQDQTGKKYEYDWLGRLIKAGSTRYTYDPTDRLMTRDHDGKKTQLMYDSNSVIGEYALDGSGDARELLPASSACTLQRSRISGVNRTLYLLCDANGTVIYTYDSTAGTGQHHAYTAYGEHFSQDTDSMLSFKGEHRDPSTGHFALGMGYRFYDPSVMRLNAMDDLSPFDRRAGRNVYAYCAEGEPVNHHDPSGHFSVSGRLRDHWGDSLPAPVSVGDAGKLINNLFWGGIGVLVAIMSGGLSLPLYAALIGLAVISLVTSVASVVLSETHPELSNVLAWVSLGTGAAGGVKTLGQKVLKLASYLGRTAAATARQLVVKAAPSLITPLRRMGLFKDYGNLSGEFATRGASRLIPAIPREIGPVLEQAKGATRLFDLGDANTIMFVTTGVLGNLSVPEGSADFANTAVGDATWLPWGSWGKYWSKVRFR